jgi:AcrR family transcriptional regulator
MQNDGGSELRGARMTTTTATGKLRVRERILASAEVLFCRNGFHATGVDNLGISKTSLYRLFGSKDDLIAAVIAAQDKRFWTWWTAVEQRHPNAPRTLLLALLTGIAGQIAMPEFRGCPFLKVAAEFPDVAHPAHILALAHKEKIRDRLCSLLQQLELPVPERIAGQILLLIDGAYVGGLMRSADLERDFVYAAMKLATK